MSCSMIEQEEILRRATFALGDGSYRPATKKEDPGVEDDPIQGPDAEGVENE